MSSNNSPIPPGFEITAGDFSLPAESQLVCQYTGDCKNPAGRTILPGERSTIIPSTIGLSYRLCRFCEAHVANRPGTIMRAKCSVAPVQLTHPITSEARLHHVNTSLIEAATSASQRGDQLRLRVGALPGLSTPQRQSAQPAVFSPTNTRFAQGPPTHAPGAGPSLVGHSHLVQRSTSNAPSASPTPTGYSSAHTIHYPAMRAQVQQLRLASDPLTLQTCTVSYSFEVQIGKSFKIAFGMPKDGIPYVSARITGVQLKELIMSTARTSWEQRTHSFPFESRFFTLRLAKTLVNLERDFAETYAIYDQCIVNSGRTPGRFAHGRKVLVLMILDNDMYETITTHISDAEVPAEENDINIRPTTPLHSAISQPHTLSHLDATPVQHADLQIAYNTASRPLNQVPPSTPRRIVCEQQALSASTLVSRAATPQIQPDPKTPKRKRSLPTSPTSSMLSPPHKRISSFGSISTPHSLTAAAVTMQSKTCLEDVLRKHGKENQVASLIGPKSCTVQFLAVPKISYSSLVSDSSLPLLELAQDFNLVNNGTISYNTSDPNTVLGSGQFKHCFLGKMTLESPPWPDLDVRSLQVALKRPFTPHPNRPNRTSRLPPDAELAQVFTEATSLQWGSSMLDSVYSYMDNLKLSTAEEQDYPHIPVLRFVHIGIAKCIGPGQKATQSLQGAFLVEEQIPRSHKFVRFLGNASATPCEFPVDSIHYCIAQFCAFAQHVQWIITNGQGYCADWQGGTDPATGDTLLTDPQLITNPNLGTLFADGNVPETYMAFPTQHICESNEFCMYFKPGPIMLPENSSDV